MTNLRSKFREIFKITFTKVAAIIIALSISCILLGMNIPVWTLTLYWHFFNNEIRFHEMVILPPLRWRLWSEGNNWIELTMVPPRKAKNPAVLTVDKKKVSFSNQNVLDFLEKEQNQGKIVIDVIEYSEIASETALRIRYHSPDIPEPRTAYSEHIIITSKRVWISHFDTPKEYKPYIEELVSSISFER